MSPSRLRAIPLRSGGTVCPMGLARLRLLRVPPRGRSPSRPRLTSRISRWRWSWLWQRILRNSTCRKNLSVQTVPQSARGGHGIASSSSPPCPCRASCCWSPRWDSIMKHTVRRPFSPLPPVVQKLLETWCMKALPVVKSPLLKRSQQPKVVNLTTARPPPRHMPFT